MPLAELHPLALKTERLSDKQISPRCWCPVQILAFGLLTCCSLAALVVAFFCVVRVTQLQRQLDDVRDELEQLKHSTWRTVIDDDQRSGWDDAVQRPDQPFSDMEPMATHSRHLPPWSQEQTMNSARSRRHSSIKTDPDIDKEIKRNQRRKTDKKTPRKSQVTRAASSTTSEISSDTVVHMQPREHMHPGLRKLPNHVIQGWRIVPWSHPFNHSHQLHNEQTLTIPKSGLYLVYAQIGYYTNAIENVFSVVVNASNNGGRQRVLTRCILGVDYVERNSQPADNRRRKTCYSATVAHLSAGERLQVHDESLVDLDQFTFHPDMVDTHYWGVVGIGVASQPTITQRRKKNSRS